MIEERRAVPTADTVRLQREAGDPDVSAWVSANAGSGKTHILTERVLRILLTGVAPENILCLTYTKAAAAEMQGRVAGRLAEWAIMDEAGLAQTLTGITSAAPDADLLRRARSLFARALETPGGLKINTIHAFCEAVLQRFPFEAGVPVGFAVVEEAEQQDMIRSAVEGVLAEGLAGHPEVGEAVATLFAALGDSSIAAAINEALARSRQLRDVLADPDGARARLAQLLGIPETLDRAEVEREIVEGCGIDRGMCDAILTASVSAGARTDKLAAIDWDDLSAEKLFEAFLTADRTPPKRFPVKDFVAAEPDLAAAIIEEADHLAEQAERLKAIDILEVSSALVGVLDAVQARYSRAKALNNRLDFDDLITSLVKLLDVREARDWVRYKLDSGITHILVDESQDTNADQWRVVEQLAEEFFAGEGAVDGKRTVFAVGDEKQSIYSFQGAEPALFAETGGQFERRAAQADKPFRASRFRASFRTLENVLGAVDLVAGDAEVRTGLMLAGDSDGHESARIDKGGLVELWPPVAPEDDANGGDTDAWPTEPVVYEQSPPNRLAKRIVGRIARWVEEKRRLGARGRAVTADDVLILVQSRGPLFGALIEELKKAGLNTPGADRLPVTQHIAMADLMALADVLINPQDDLTLAALLRSPLFAVTEDELMQLGRGGGKSFWRALEAAQDELDWAASAFARLRRWRQRLDFERPYEFFAHVLYAEGGLKMLHARLGTEIDDVIAEFLDLALDHERADQPGLLGFLAEMRARDISVKRELSESGAGVRVMTIHGAKGLEAPIVILADAATCRIKSGPIYLQGGSRPLLAHVPNKKVHTAQSAATLLEPDEDRQKQEYWRKLYVGMTRAEDELYITGFLNKGGAGSKIEGTWYDKVERALEPYADQVPLDDEDGTTVLRFPKGVEKAAAIEKEPETGSAPPTLPDLSPLAPPTLVETISPSRAVTHGSDISTALKTSATEALGDETAPRDADFARRRGIALHALLQHLEKVPEAMRGEVAHNALAVLLPNHPETHEALVERALDIFNGDHATTLFGPDSRAELPFLLNARNNGKKVRIAGRIDRAIVTDSEALLVDFKSDAAPPDTVGTVDPAYIVQLGLYRLAGKNLFAGRAVRAALFWTATGNLMELPESTLIEATRAYTIE